MKRFLAFRAVNFVSVACLVAFGCLTILGQATRSISTVQRRLDDFNRQSQQVARDEMNRELGGRKPNAEERRLAAAKKTQIREDFESLQTLYNDVLTKLQTKEAMTDDYIAETSGKISKAGSRLRENIEFPIKSPVDSKLDSPPRPDASLKILCLQLHGFLTNPMFETGVLDIVEAEKARDTLDKVIQTATDLRRQLGKID